jgi:Gpi18-like mannosyltransferase
VLLLLLLLLLLPMWLVVHVVCGTPATRPMVRHRCRFPLPLLLVPLHRNKALAAAVYAAAIAAIVTAAVTAALRC